MADVTLTDLLGSNPVTAALDGSEPLETVVSGTSEAATIRQLSFSALEDDSSAAYTLVLTDQGKVRTMSSASANTVTVPLNSSVAFPTGCTLVVRQIGSGVTTLAPDGGVTLTYVASGSLAITEQYGQATLHKIADDEWHLHGDI